MTTETETESKSKTPVRNAVQTFTGLLGIVLLLELFLTPKEFLSSWYYSVQLFVQVAVQLLLGFTRPLPGQSAWTNKIGAILWLGVAFIWNAELRAIFGF